MLSKKHFEAMAEHIARETKPGSKEREGAMHLAVSTAKASNPRFDEGRFRGAVEGLDKGTHTVGDTGRIRRVSGASDVKKLSSGITTRPVMPEHDPAWVAKQYGVSHQQAVKMANEFARANAQRAWGPSKVSIVKGGNSGGGAGDEPRDDHGRWTK